MGITSFLTTVIKPFINVPKWIGYSQLKTSTRGIKDIVKGLFIPAQPTRQEAFAEAIVRLGLTEADIEQRKKEFSRLQWTFLIIGLVIFSYGIYLFSEGSFKGGIASVAITLVPLAQAFRYHFWLFQLRQRKLGCTFREVLAFYFAGNKK